MGLRLEAEMLMHKGRTRLDICGKSAKKINRKL